MVTNKFENSNPLFPEFNSPVNFEKLKPGDITEASKKVIEFARKQIDKISGIEKEERTLSNTLKALDDIYNEIGKVHSSVFLMAYVHPDSGIRDKSLGVINELNQFINELNMSPELYEAVKEYKDTDEAERLTGSDKKFMEDTIRDFEHNGLGFPKEKREKIKSIQDKISELGVQFETNISSHKDELIVSGEEIKGLPEDYKEERKMDDGTYRIDLSYPSYFPFMKYAESDEARKQLSEKFKNIAADKNLEILDKILVERKRLTELHGYSSFAEYQLKLRMAKTPEKVWKFEEKLRQEVQKKADIDYQQLLGKKREYKKDPSVDKIHSWESAFYSTMLLRENYQVDDEEIKQYFELDKALEGLFHLSKVLFGIEFKELQNPPVWHDEVRMFEVYESGQLRGRFYLDLFPRDDKFNHAACFDIISGKSAEQGYQLPHAALVTNFPKPTKNKPSLLTHSDVITLFHEFGHLLHNILTKAPYAEQAGTNTVRDFVEVPSQILENWAWEYDALKQFAKHYKTGEPLPENLHKRMLEAKNIGSGLFTLQQIFYGMLDMTYHDKYDPENDEESTTDIVRRLQNEITCFEYMENTHFQAGFGHLVGYEAGYYSYLWAKVYAEDMFSLFKKNGILNKEMGEKFKQKVLEKGSSVEEEQIARDFLEREVEYSAFLDSIGLEQ